MTNDAAKLWPPKAKAVIFDFDGTLANTAGIWQEVDIAFLKRRGLTYDDDYSQRLAALGFVDGAHYTIERYGLHESVEEILQEWTAMSRRLYRERVHLRPGAERYVRKLNKVGIPCALATTNNVDILGSLEQVDVLSLFHTCVFGVDVGRGKDHPDIYLEAARRLEVEPTDCLVFEDIPPAARAAHSVGMTVCGVKAHDFTQKVAELKREADLWLESWLDIPI